MHVKQTTWMAIGFWIALSTTILGMLLQHMSVGAAVTTLGAGGLVFTAAVFLLWLRDGGSDRG